MSTRLPLRLQANDGSHARPGPLPNLQLEFEALAGEFIDQDCDLDVPAPGDWQVDAIESELAGSRNQGTFDRIHPQRRQAEAGHHLDRRQWFPLRVKQCH